MLQTVQWCRVDILGHGSQGQEYIHGHDNKLYWVIDLNAVYQGFSAGCQATEINHQEHQVHIPYGLDRSRTLQEGGLRAHANAAPLKPLTQDPQRGS